MEKWIVGMEEHQSVEYVVTYEVSAKKQTKKCSSKIKPSWEMWK